MATGLLDDPPRFVVRPRDSAIGPHDLRHCYANGGYALLPCVRNTGDNYVSQIECDAFLRYLCDQNTLLMNYLKTKFFASV